MIRTLVLASALTVACGNPSPEPATAPPESSGSTSPAAEPAVAPELAAEAAQAPQPAPSPTRMRAALGAEAVAIVEGATTVEVGRMRVIGAMQAENARLTSGETVAGYPIEGELTAVASDVRAELVALLFADESYRWDIERRCANDYLVGLRFTRGDARVEFGLGMPCEQGFFVFRGPEGIASDGAILTETAAQAVVRRAP